VEREQNVLRAEMEGPFREHREQENPEEIGDEMRSVRLALNP
jgi:hypothetical protein